jgi:hypothetical protein
LDDRLIQIRPGNLKAITDALDLSSNYGQTSHLIFIDLPKPFIVNLQHYEDFKQRLYVIELGHITTAPSFLSCLDKKNQTRSLVFCLVT